MPTNGYHGDCDKAALMRLAREQVMKKFPNIVVGSAGYWRAVDNRYRRLV